MTQTADSQSSTRPARRDVLEKHRSLWLHEALGDEPDAPPLTGRTSADVCIVGGGFVGLWTAYWLKQWDPGCDVVVLESDICGGGASGRNGGFVLSWWAKFPSLEKLLGSTDAIEVCRQSAAAIGEIGEIAGRHGIDAQFTKGGWLWTARTPSQLGAWDETVEATAAAAPGMFIELSDAEVGQRAGSPRHLAGVLEPSAATIHPGLLVRGLRRVCLELGVRIHEHTRVSGFTRGESPVRVRTGRGEVAAERLVIATNAWAAGVRELHRRLVVVSSDIVATARIPDRLARIGWTGGECITDSQLMVNYYRTTRDGRIVFGKGGWGIALGGWIPRSFDESRRRARGVTADLHHAYPQIRDVPIEYDWCGPIDRTSDGLPFLGNLGGHENILYGVGWSGNGVGPSILGGKLLASRLLDRDTAEAPTPLWNRSPMKFPPDPIRYVGAHVVREAVRRKELAEQEGRRPNRLHVALSKLVPAGLEDH
jgi:glycine/D-amino acid oxidase-like deaminating enzyme